MENIAIISSSKDAAGANTRSSLIEMFGFDKMPQLPNSTPLTEKSIVINF